MTKDREIVLMLIRRKRFAHRCWRQLAKQIDQELIDGLHKDHHPLQWLLDIRYVEYNEAHNAAECARRILYDTEL